MRPALRSDASAVCLVLMLMMLLLSPVLLSWLGLPPRSEAYKSISTSAGTVGAVIQAIDQSPRDADVVFLGSSLVSAGISQQAIRTSLSEHLHRDANVQVLAMNWPGLDVQYFMLRDYLNTHTTHLLVWNLPEPHARAYEYPHIQAYRWIRFGEYADALDGLSFRYRAALYGEMVIGAPRQFLSMVRPNLIRDEGKEVDPALARSGFMGEKFVEDDSLLNAPRSNARLLSLDSNKISVRGPDPGPYQMHFARLIVEIARKHDCRIVLLHIPLDVEFGQKLIPELSDWKTRLAPDLSMLAAPSSDLFEGMDRPHFNHFYRDAHLNENGRRYFTQAILPAIEQAFDESTSINE